MKNLIYNQKFLVLIGLVCFIMMLITGGEDFLSAPVIGKVFFILFGLIVIWSTIGIVIVNYIKKRKK